MYLQRVLNKRTQKFIVATRTHSDIYDFKFIYINVKANIYSVQILENTECIDRTERGTICASKTPFLKIRRQTYSRQTYEGDTYSREIIQAQQEETAIKLSMLQT